MSETKPSRTAVDRTSTAHSPATGDEARHGSIQVVTEQSNEGSGTGKGDEDGEEDNVFEIEDYTTASPWERFVARIEGCLWDWGLSSSSKKKHVPVKAERTSKKELEYLKVSYILELHLAPEQAGHDEVVPLFPTRAHHLTRWFGVRSFLLLRPTAGSVSDESHASLLLSSLVLAMGNVKCGIPGFVTVFDKDRGSHRGYRIAYDDPIIPTSLAYSVDRITEPPPSYRHLSGLVELFESKAATHTSSDIYAATRFTYVLDTPDPQWFSLTTQDPRVSRDLYILWDNSDPDPVESLHIAAIWSSYLAADVTDNNAYSDLDPRNAPQWTLRLIDRPVTSAPVSTLFRRLTQAMHKAPTGAASSAVGGLAQADDSQPEALDSPHEPTSRGAQLLDTVGQVTRSVTASLNAEVPPDPEEIDLVLQELFEPSYYSDVANDDQDKEGSTPTDAVADDSSSIFGPRQVAGSRQVPKTCPIGSLTSNFSIFALKQPGLRAILTLFHEFVRELRWHWDHAVPLPGFSDEPPDISACLLHQKLQLLAICIIKREKAGEGIKPGNAGDGVDGALDGHAQGNGDNDGDDDDDNDVKGGDDGDSFHDTVSEHNMSTKDGDDGGIDHDNGDNDDNNDDDDDDDDDDVDYSIGDPTVPRSGADHVCGDILLLRTGLPMYAPEVQNHSYMTEDMVLEQQEIMSSLGTSEMGARIRAQMQSAGVRSDMQAFKAANPGAVLDDFVRWHSSRDFLLSKTHPRNSGTVEGESADSNTYVDMVACPAKGGSTQVVTPPALRGNEVLVWELRDGRYGYLSHRMSGCDNLWATLWRKAAPQAVKEQTSLFDHTREGEKALHYFETIHADDLMQQVLRLALDGLLFHLRRYSGTYDLDPVDACLEELEELIGGVYAQHDDPDAAALSAVANAIEEAEFMCATALSLLHKLPGLTRLVCVLASKGIVEVESGEERKTLTELLTQSAMRAHRGSAWTEDAFPAPGAREVILTRGKSRMYSQYTNKEFRLATTVPADG